MIWIFAAVVFAFYAVILIFRDDTRTSERIRSWLYVLLIILALGGGLMFARSGRDEGECTSYSSFAKDC
jgi:hypothetical protein